MRELNTLASKLDLGAYLERFESYFSRPKSYVLEGDIHLHFSFTQQLSNFDFDKPPAVKSLHESILSLKKFGYINIEEIAEFIKIIRYFYYLKRFSFTPQINEWIAKIEIPDEVRKIEEAFDKNYAIKRGYSDDLDRIHEVLERHKIELNESFSKLIYKKSLEHYLVDRQIHIANGEECLLLRGGFNTFLDGTIIARSHGGFFYVVPRSVDGIKHKIKETNDKKEQLLVKIAKEFSGVLTKWVKFVEFIDRTFDRFDHYQARVFFAKAGDLSFVLSDNSTKIILSDFIHPALAKPKPISIDFSKSLLMLTGVNAGGKTMMLKSILSAVFLSKHLLPMRLDTNRSRIGRFKNIFAILDDPQSVKNDISTFAGRMVEFADILGNHSKELNLIGVDEIELGTDSDEASALFKAILTKLKNSNSKIVVTTHHKRLAALMASDEQTELAAAMYDEKEEKPTYEFLQGIIGKSFAFETALRYRIPPAIVAEAKEIYGEDKDRLNDLIHNSYRLEAELRAKIALQNEQLTKLENLKTELTQKIEFHDELLSRDKAKLQSIYHEATTKAKEAAKTKTQSEAHQLLNEAHKIVSEAKINHQKVAEEIKVGQYVRFNHSRGKVESIGKNDALVVFENGMKFRVKLSELKIETIQTEHKKSQKVSKPLVEKASITLDLHGQRGEEAMENLDKFISDALLGGFDEVLVYHGMGSGILAKLTKEFLREHPSVKSFSDAPPNMGGFGAKIVKL